MSASAAPSPRIRVDGKSFRLGGGKFHVKGLSYGPFAPNARNEPYPTRERVREDFRLLRELGANLIRVYTPPPAWFLALAEDHALKLLIDIPWATHLCFLESQRHRQEARQAVQNVVRATHASPAVFAYSVANEIRPDLVRWSGPRAIERFIDELIEIGRREAPEALFTYSSYPSTEFLNPQATDFLTFNVYLHDPEAFERYLARLQLLANGKPLLLGEFGMDARREGESRQAELVRQQIEIAFRAGLAGVVLFSFTDEWHRGGEPVTDWAFGVTTVDRQPRPSFTAVQEQFARAPYFPLPRTPKVSVVVACYNGEQTLDACLASLRGLNYPDYEVLLVDDGSTDRTRAIARRYDHVRVIEQSHSGLSVARNTGIAAAQGEMVAFTDADCRADEDWLYYLMGDLLRGGYAGIGGPNLPPPEDSCIAATVAASPGMPAPVLLTDREAEHLPGCNMAFPKWVLESVGGFDPQFTRAGDDVDICWRLRERGQRLGYSPAGFVWHYRRATVTAYLRQQSGYGEAEALLERKHPENFTAWGASQWRGRIYTPTPLGLRLRGPVIYHGVFGSALFQRIYAPEPASLLMLFTTLEYHALVVAPLIILAVWFPSLLPLALASLLVPVCICAAAAWQAELPPRKRRPWSRALVALLYFLQPIVRGWARYRARLQGRPRPEASLFSYAKPQSAKTGPPPRRLYYWTQQGPDRVELLKAVSRRLEEEDWPYKIDAGWSRHDLEIFGNRWSRVRVVTAAEELGQGKRMFRFRLEPAGSFWARVLGAMVTGLAFLLVGLLSPTQPWIWAVLVVLPMLFFYLRRDQQRLVYGVAALLDDVARRRGLVKIEYDPVSEKYRPVAADDPARQNWKQEVQAANTVSGSPSQPPGESIPGSK